MLRIEVTRELPVSLHEGFDYITSIRNWRSYWPGAVEVPDAERTSWSKPGDRARVIVHRLGRPVEMAMELEEFRPYERVVYRTAESAMLPAARHERHFREKDGRLEYRLVMEFEPRAGLRGLGDRLVAARSVKRALVETADNLDRIFRR